MVKKIVSGFRRIDKEALMQRLRTCTRDFMSVFAHMDVEFETHATVPDDVHEPVTAVIQFEGMCRGLVSLHCPEPMAVRIASGMLGVPLQGINEQVRKALAEFVTILGSDIKLFLSPGGKNLSLSLPFVYQGGHENISFRDDPEHLFCSFRHANESFLVGIMLRKEV